MHTVCCTSENNFEYCIYMWKHICDFEFLYINVKDCQCWFLILLSIVSLECLYWKDIVNVELFDHVLHFAMHVDYIALQEWI